VHENHLEELPNCRFLGLNLRKLNSVALEVGQESAYKEAAT
jgi:hypothetical protein